MQSVDLLKLVATFSMHTLIHASVPMPPCLDAWQLPNVVVLQLATCQVLLSTQTSIEHEGARRMTDRAGRDWLPQAGRYVKNSAVKASPGEARFR